MRALSSLVLLCTLLVCTVCFSYHIRPSISRTKLACSQNSVVTNPSNIKHKIKTIKLILTTGTMCLTEMVDNEVIESLVEFDENGNIIFLTSGGNGVQDVRGIWSHGKNENVLKMIIERTYLGKFSSKTIKSQYVGLLNQQSGTVNNVIAVGKEMDLNMQDSESIIDKGEVSFNNIINSHDNGAFFLSNIILSDKSADNSRSNMLNENVLHHQ